MAGFDILQQPYQYHEPVAPVLPRENDAAKLIASTTDTVVGSFLRAATARKEMDLERQKMATSAAIQFQNLDLEEKKMKDDYELRKMLYESYQTNADANMIRAGNAVKSLTDAATQRAMIDQELQRYNDGIKKEPEYQVITNPVLMESDPVKWHAAFQRFADNHASDQLSIAADTIKRLKPAADQQKIPFRAGAVWVPEHVATRTNEAGSEIKQVVAGNFDLRGTESRDVPIWQIAKDYAATKPDSPERNRILWGLMAAGQDKIVQSLTENTDESGNPVKVRKTVRSVSPQAQKILDSGLNTDFSRGTDKTPEEMTKPYKKGGALGIDYGTPPQDTGLEDSGSVLPEPDLPPTAPGSSIESPSGPINQGSIGTPTQTDKTIEYAKRAIARGAPMSAVAERLRTMNIDPHVLLS